MRFVPEPETNTSKLPLHTCRKSNQRRLTNPRAEAVSVGQVARQPLGHVAGHGLKVELTGGPVLTGGQCSLQTSAHCNQS